MAVESPNSSTRGHFDITRKRNVRSASNANQLFDLFRQRRRGRELSEDPKSLAQIHGFDDKSNSEENQTGVVAINLDLENEDYKTKKLVRIQSRELYDGFIDKPENKGYYLHKSKSEDDDVFNTRVKLSYYDNLLRMIVKARQALFWRKTPTLEIPNYLEEYLEDIDGRKSEHMAFFQNITENAEVDGIAWVLVDKPSVSIPRVLSEQEEIDFGIRPFMRFVPAENVIDWGFDPNTQKLTYAVIRSEVEFPKMPGIETPKRKQWKVWTRNTWQIYYKSEEKNQNNEPSFYKVDEGTHSAGEVPLVPFYGKKVKPYCGEPVGSQVLDHCVATYNKTSHIDYAIWKTINPIPYVIAAENPGDVNVSGQKGYFIKLPNNPNLKGNPDIGFVEMKGTGIEIAIQERNHLIKRVYEFGLSSTKRESKLVESDRTLKQQETIQRSDLMAVATNSETSIRQCFDLFEVLLGKPYSEKIVSCNRDFDDQIIEASMIAQFREAVRDNLMSKEEFIKILHGARLYNNPVFTVEEELAKLDKEQEERQNNLPNFVNNVQSEDNQEEEDSEEEPSEK